MTECGRCGDCCEDIHLSTTKRRMRKRIMAGDPRDDAVWQRWVDRWIAEDGELTARREDFVREFLTAAFVVEHWHGGKRGKGGTTEGWSCDAFDPVSRLCTAHDDRPPICSDFPYYNTGQPEVIPSGRLPKRCSFWADYAPEHRPPEWVPVSFVGIIQLPEGKD